MKQRKIILTEKEIPTHWYNIVADMENKPRPPLHPGTQEPIGPEMLAPLFPEELIRQEVSQEKWIEIPKRFGRFIRFGGRHRFFVPMVWRRHWIRRQRSIIKMKGLVRLVPINPIRRLRRLII